MLVVTREWLDKISDEQGLTRGQVKLLEIWAEKNGEWCGEIPDQVARFIEGCKGYRGEAVNYLKALRSNHG